MRETIPEKKVISEKTAEHDAAQVDREKVREVCADLTDKANTVLERLRARVPKVRLVKAGHR